MNKGICKVLLTAALVVILGVPAAADGTQPPGTPNGVTAPPTYNIGEPVPEKRVAVMNLRVEGEHADLVRDWMPALIEDRLLAAGWTLVVRGERMGHIQDEQNLPGVKPGTAPQKNELLGATALLELTARIKVQEILGIGGIGILGAGSLARVDVDLIGQITDPSTGVLKTSINVSGTDTGLKSFLLATIGRTIGGVAFDIKDIRQSLVGKASDRAAQKLVDRLISVYPAIPGGKPSAGVTSLGVDPGQALIVLSLPAGTNAHPGDRYGIYRGDELIAEVEIVKITGNQAEVRVISQKGPVRSTDRARRMPVVIEAE